MSIYFSKIIKAGDRQREFNFTQVTNNPESGYAVDVPDDRGERIYFHLFRNDNGQWTTPSEGLPPWIYGATTAFSAAIEEHKSERATVRV
ncbi:MAG TPA: hypothetical protein VGE66_14275 [Chitinophagaceae bacterium]